MVPKSVAIIPDGNRRFSKKASISLEQAYLAGFNKVHSAVDWAQELGVGSLSFWALSIDNFSKRASRELDVLFFLMGRKLTEALSDNRFKERGVRVKFFGKRELLPSSLQERFNALEQNTLDNNQTELHIGVAYGGKQELLDAARGIARDAAKGALLEEELNEKKFEQYLYFAQSPDLVIRTGEVQRLSGFMPWQTGYSELFFSSKLWPDFERADFVQAVEFYSQAKRNFGK